MNCPSPATKTRKKIPRKRTKRKKAQKEFCPGFSDHTLIIGNKVLETDYNQISPDMENYVIRFTDAQREAVMNVISRSNDVIINRLEENSVGITVQLDEADAAYGVLLEDIERELGKMQILLERTS